MITIRYDYIPNKRLILGKIMTIVSGEHTAIQDNLYAEVIAAIDAGNLQQLNEALNTFKSGWSTDEKSIFKQKIKDEFGIKFNKIKIRMTTSSWSWRPFGWITRSVELSPLQLAANRCDKNIVDFLIRNMDPADRSPYDPIKVNAHPDDVNQDIVDIDGIRYVNDATPLHLAAAQGHSELIKAFSADKLMLNEKDAQQNTPLHLAAYCGRVDNVGILLAAGANANARNVANLTFDHYALQYNTSLSKATIDKLTYLRINPPKPDNNPNIAPLQNFDDFNIAFNSIRDAKARVNKAIKSAGKDLTRHEKLGAYDGNLITLENNLKFLNQLIKEGYESLEKQEKNAKNNNVISDAKRKYLNNLKKRTIETTNTIASSVENNVLSEDNTAALLSYHQTVIESIYVLSDSPQSKKWLIRLFFAVLAIGLALTGIGLLAEVIGVSFAAALTSVFTLSALEAAPAAGAATMIAATSASSGVATGIASTGLLLGAAGWGMTEFAWLNRRGKNVLAAVEDNLNEINRIKISR